MAHYGWMRTSTDIGERGGARVTGFDLSDFKPDGFTIDRDALWKNFEYFIRAVLPEAEKYGIRLALHPDDPPLEKLGRVARIFTSLESIKKGIVLGNSPSLGIAFCQACCRLMGESLDEAVTQLADKIFFIHFRNVCGTKTSFRETFHDNGDISMSSVMKLYYGSGIDVPIRVDHVPTLAGETSANVGYDALGRMFAIGYLKGLMEANENVRKNNIRS